MRTTTKILALAGGGGGLLAVGVFMGSAFSTGGSVPADSAGPAAAQVPVRVSVRAPHAVSHRSVDSGDSALLVRIREARALPDGGRAGQLLRTLEESARYPLSAGLLEEFRSLLSEGELASCHYVLSLMEQREEAASVGFLLEASAHPDPDIAGRALFALEAVAGTVFKDREAAQTWASSWKPDPDRARLFSPAQGVREDESATSPPREMAPDKVRAK